MKLALSLVVTLGALLPLAGQAKSICHLKAEQSVASSVENNYYDENGFETIGCDQAANQSAVICDVAASKGDGAAMDTYRVVLNLACTKTFRVELTGEE